MADNSKPMPKVTPMPPPPTRPNRLQHDTFAEEALRVAQRHLDQVQEIGRLGEELEEWRRRATMAEAEIKRLARREEDLQATLERERDRLIDERDGFRMRLNNMMAQFHTAGAVILKCIEAGSDAASSPVNLTILANEVEKAQQQLEPDEPMPRTVTAG